MLILITSQLGHASFLPDKAMLQMYCVKPFSRKYGMLLLFIYYL
jgi:hypothetical protein